MQLGSRRRNQRLVSGVLGGVPLTGQKTSVLSDAFEDVSSALAVCLSQLSTKKFARGSPRNDDRQLGQPHYIPGFIPPHEHFPFPK